MAIFFDSVRKLFEKVFEKVFNLALKSAKASLAWLIKLLKAISEKLKKGTKAVTNGIKEFFEELKKALDDVFPKWRKTGTGGDYKTLKLLSRNVIGQEWHMSCAAASVKQLSKDFGLEINESQIRKLLKTDKILGSSVDNIEFDLKNIFKNKKVTSNWLYLEGGRTSRGWMEFFCNNKRPWIANIKPAGSKGHTIIVDEIIGNKVKIRDPWPPEGKIGENGIEGLIDIDEFLELWNKGGEHYTFID